MKHTLIFTFFLVLTLGACVSKKKYNALNQQHQQALNDKVTLEDVFTKMSVENDSLKNQIILLDSLLRQASLKKAAARAAECLRHLDSHQPELEELLDQLVIEDALLVHLAHTWADLFFRELAHVVAK